MKVTIRDIAKEAGVSPASVSLVLNDKPCRIADETKARIIETAKRRGYQRTQKKEKEEAPKAIGMLLPNINEGFMAQCAEGVSVYAGIYDYKNILCHTVDNTEKCVEYIDFMEKMNVQGIILVPPLDMNTNDNHVKLGEALHKLKIPFLLLDRAIDRVFCDFITSDNKSGAYMATEHLILSGHDEIGIIAGLREVYNTRKRLEGYKEAMVFYGKSIKEENIYYGNFQKESGYAAAEYFWKRGVHAVFAMNDAMAFGVYLFAKDNGLKIGEDISVVGFNDDNETQFMTPPLTSVAQTAELMGRKACEILLKRISKENKEEIRNTYFAPSLVERGSVKKINNI